MARTASERLRRRIAVALVAATAAGGPWARNTASGSEPSRGTTRVARDDRDGDGVLDALDNCLAHANADQRDTDRDGAGNRCDADFDQDGTVGDADLTELRRALGTAARTMDLDGNRRVDDADLRLFRELAGKPPGPVLDSDGHGWADAADPCPTTAPRARLVLDGAACESSAAVAGVGHDRSSIPAVPSWSKATTTGD